MDWKNYLVWQIVFFKPRMRGISETASPLAAALSVACKNTVEYGVVIDKGVERLRSGTPSVHDAAHQEIDGLLSRMKAAVSQAYQNGQIKHGEITMVTAGMPLSPQSKEKGLIVGVLARTQASAEIIAGILPDLSLVNCMTGERVMPTAVQPAPPAPS